MSFKGLQSSQGYYICDICGKEMENITPLGSLSLYIKQDWWKIQEIKHYDICKKHRKAVEVFLKELKEEGRK